MNIYHRIYKLHQRKVPAQQIAATTNMPLKSVRSILKKFSQRADGKIGGENGEFSGHAPYLDTHIYKQHKYTIIDLSGFLIKDYFDKINETIDEVIQYSGSLVALKLDSILSADDETLQHLANKAETLQKNGKTMVLFAPSNDLEREIERAGIEKKIRILGTQGAFEEYMYRITHRG